MRDHAYRRHHKDRMRAKCFWIQKQVRYWGRITDIHAKDADNLQPCSCIHCGNPRKWWKAETLAEYAAALDFHEQHEETPRPRYRRR